MCTQAVVPSAPASQNTSPRVHCCVCALPQHPGQEQGSRGVVIDGVFGLLLTERVRCQACGQETHKVPKHYEHLIVVNSASLNLAAMTLPDASMDRLLAFLFAQETKFCDKDVGGCGEPNVSRVHGDTCRCSERM